jgi:DNA-binding NarL/FixJ family response regulator
MSVQSVLRPVGRDSAAPAGWGVAAAPGMSQTDAAAALAISAAVVALALSDPENALYSLLAVPIWIVSRDLGLLAGAAAAASALLFGVILAAEREVGLLEQLDRAAVFTGAVAAGALARPPNRNNSAKRRAPLPRLLTARPEITRRAEALSRRELEILEMIATGAKNAEIAARFVISENTVKSHVSQILKKLPASNRTQAAYRYIELYGTPPTPNPNPTTSDTTNQHTDRINAASAASATVSALPHKDRLALSLQDGRDLEVPLLEPIRDRVEIGTPAIVYFDQHNRPVGWYLPDQELGVDLRHWTP